MANAADIRDTLATIFARRDLAGLARLLGFAAEAQAVPSLRAALPAATPVTDVFPFGMRGTLCCYGLHCRMAPAAAEIARAARALRNHNLTQLQLYLFACDDFAACTIASFGLGEELLALTLQRDRIHASDVEAVQEMIPAGDERGAALAARHARALDRSRVTRRFFSDFAAQRDRVAAAWLSLPAQLRRDRDQLALLLLSRLMFLYFLQHRDYLDGDSRYLVRRFRSWQGRTTFYRGVLKPLFFSVLNRRRERRPARALALGDLPYLNGGLFEAHALERKHRGLDLGDAALAHVFDDLLERYRFTARETADVRIEGVQDAGVDPEMLGRVFEGLMAARERATTGTFYTPAATVDRLVCDALVAHLEPRLGTAASAIVREGNCDGLDAQQRTFAAKLLRETRVLDPACGSGAFLLGALSRIAQARSAVEGVPVMPLRREVVAHALHGVDLQSDAALLCALRLWLALVPGNECQAVQPLPNLDRLIRQGDTLVDPLDLRATAANADVRRCIAALQPASAAYVHSEPEHRPALQRALLRSERRLARAWTATLLRAMRHRIAELRALARQKDLFGDVPPEAIAARQELAITLQRGASLRRLERAVRSRDERPFFSYGVHFADATLRGFDVVLCNPPWVRSHNWPRAITGLVRSRFETCRANTWHPPGIAEPTPGGGNQVDLALLFLERAIELLAPGGALGIVLPAKFIRSLSGAAARRLLLARTDIISIEDHSLDQRSIFTADAFASLIVARKRVASTDATAPPFVHVTTVQRGSAPLRYTAHQRELSLFEDDARSPWLLVPPDVRRALARMRAGPMIGEQPDLRIRRGVVTGANDVMVLERANAKLGGLAAIRAEGFESAAAPANFEAIVEQSAIARAARGCDIGAWSFRPERFVICRRPGTPQPLQHLAKYLSKHERALSDVPRAHCAQAMVAWHDLASTLNAVVLAGDVVPINTVYFIPVDEQSAHVLAAYFNSLPVRTFARAIAERAKDAHFRFFAWTIALVPLPPAWRTFETSRLVETSRAAHARGGLDADAQNELDGLIARAYGLSRFDMRALASFDAWLRRA